MQEQQSTINQGSSLWIGLDSYKESNSGIFFGRDEEIRQLSGDIFNNIQTVIYGPSGTGKTSIIRAGIFKIARANRYLPVYVRLNHIMGSKTYTQQIIDAIQDEAEKHNIDIENSSPYIKENVCQSLWEYFHCNEFWNEENYPVVPLIVVDQFEEIFTLGKNLSLQPDFFSQLSDLCDNKYPQYVIDYLNDRNNERIEYPEAINYRIVISLREDFLARLEEQAETIPALKRNRFSLQCINEEQALDIILKPQPGLVSEDVAALIIEKVTNKKYNKDFKFHDDPEILVEPAILSLFCRELDKKRREKGLPTLSSELIGEFGDNIIRDFYINSLSALSEGNEENHSPLPTRDEKIDYLESRLITVDGFRDAVAYQNAIAFGFTQKDIKTLIDNRLVRIDEWDGTRRIEFIHDVLCKVANKHRKEREQEKENKKKEEEQNRRIQELERSKKRQKYIYGGIVALLLAVLSFCIFWFGTMPKDDSQMDTSLYQICLKAEVLEDGKAKNSFGPDDYWDVNLLFWTNGGDSLYLAHQINSTECNFHKGGIGTDRLTLTFTRAEIDSLKEITLEIRPKSTMCSKYSLPINLVKHCKTPDEVDTILVSITKNIEETDSYEGSVYAYLENSIEPIPLNQALVVVAGRTFYTDTAGHYALSIPRGNAFSNRIYIIKQGYCFVDTVLKDNIAINLRRDTTMNFRKRRDEVLDLWEIAHVVTRAKAPSAKDRTVMEKFQIDDKKKLRRGLNVKDSLFFVYYDNGKVQNIIDSEADNVEAKVGDVRNIIGTYRDKKKRMYIFEGFITMENPDSAQWLLDITQYDTIFNTRKLKATLTHTNEPSKTKILFDR